MITLFGPHEESEQKEKKRFFDRLQKAVSSTKQSFMGRVEEALKGRKEFDEALWTGLEEALIASEVLVGELSLSLGQTMTFLFDFGDNWEFDLLLEAIEADHDREKAEILEGHGEAPEQYEYYDEDEFEDYDDE